MRTCIFAGRAGPLDAKLGGVRNVNFLVGSPARIDWRHHPHHGSTTKRCADRECAGRVDDEVASRRVV